MYNIGITRGPFGPNSLTWVNSFKWPFKFSLYVYKETNDPLGWGQFWPQSYNFNNFRLDNASSQISKLYPLWFWRRFFKFSLYVYKKTNDTRGGANFNHRVIIRTRHVSLKQMCRLTHAYQVWNDLDLQWQSYAPDKEIRMPPPPPTKVIPICRLFRRHKNFCRGPLDNVSCQISKL